MARVFWPIVLGAVLISAGAVHAERGDAPVAATVIAVVSGAEIDVVITESAIEDTLAAHTIARVVYHGIVSPGRFDPLYMEAFDLNWNLVSDSKVFLQPASVLWDEEERLHAYVFLDPSGYGMVNAFLLASGLASIDPGFVGDDPYTAFLTGIAAIAKRASLGVWREATE